MKTRKVPVEVRYSCYFAPNWANFANFVHFDHFFDHVGLNTAELRCDMVHIDSRGANHPHFVHFVPKLAYSVHFDHVPANFGSIFGTAGADLVDYKGWHSYTRNNSPNCAVLGPNSSN